MKARRITISTIATLCAVAFVGCSHNEGKATFDFLKAEREIIDETVAKIRQLPFPKVPVTPGSARGMTVRQRKEAEKKYSEAMEQYCGGMIHTTDQVMALLNDAQTRLSRLDASGIDKGAIALTKSYDQLLGDVAQEMVEFKALITLARDEFRQKKQDPVFKGLVVGVLEGIFTGSWIVGGREVLKSVSRDTQQKNDISREAEGQLLRFQEARSAVERDRSRTFTRRSELATTLRSRYAGFAWGLVLLPPAKAIPEHSRQGD
jgi:hypothetical protein